MANESLPEIDKCERAEERVPTYRPARIQTSAGRFLGVLLDISPSGGRLYVNRPVELGSEIVVQLGNSVERSASVRRCVPVPETQKFDVGFELMQSRWPDDLLPGEG